MTTHARVRSGLKLGSAIGSGNLQAFEVSFYTWTNFVFRENDKELHQLRDFLNKFPNSKEQREEALRVSGKGDEQTSDQVPLYNELNELISQIDPLPAQTELIRAVNSITAPEAAPVAVPGPSGLSSSSSISFSLAATPGPSGGVALAPAGPLGTISFEKEFSLPADDNSDPDEAQASEEPVVVKIKKQRRTHEVSFLFIKFGLMGKCHY